ncbi:hypothetical protein D6855_12870 [Butyrivibrio sp. CB08]|uniref:hypothetical protein n=1 Tax=Butyrivibrio sp. CB08 TaxID=2364879 RepID=UPI000EAA2B63|nr:hypothetical protein [Butyrivibrio sp. CB08]RKM57935.1 hypothetical protein D6855_12870 [Butyrivibrio sp. CB08]
MAISIGGIGSAYGMSFIQPMNYPVKNEGSVSDAFMETGMSNAIMNVPPVVYPNAQEIPKADDESDPLALSINTVQKSQEANRMYNDVASKFQGMTTGYAQNSEALSYGMSGSAIDLYA